MARKDERGVVIRAPLKFNNPATASLPRYDDEHRGPAVTDSYELSHCRIDLAEHSETWPAPENPPTRMVAIAQGIPDNQRADWLRRQANLEEVDRIISYAMRSGDLPIWVSPIGEPEQLVAPGAMIEVDHATVVSGCYRPPNDRGWLYGRPLFVKKDDWVRFVTEIRVSKAAMQVSPIYINSGSPAAEQAQRISAREAIRELHQRVKAAVSDPDPAPWLDVSPAMIEMFSEGDEAAYVRRKKMEERSALVMQRALLVGDLHAHFSDGLDFQDIPGWAWERSEKTDHVWLEGRLPLDVFLPEEWQRWSCHLVYLDRDAFTKWMDRQSLGDPDGLTELPPPYDSESKPEAVKNRLPPDTPFVTLSEALTWIAFSFALDRDSLDRAISGQAIDAIDPQAALADAMANLAVRASGGQIAARGKYVENHSTDESKVLTAPIDPVRFEDFAQFDILHDGLRYGTGLTWEKRNNTLDRVLQARRDAFRSVKVNRADLLKHFPVELDDTRALLTPLPATLPGIGLVMGLEEAICWTAHGKPSNDLLMWETAAGELLFRDHSGTVFELGEDREVPEEVALDRRRRRAAMLAIWNAMRDGSLFAYVAPADGQPFTVPRIYWNGVNTECLDLVYRGMFDADAGRGCPILLLRQAFDIWRAAIGIPHSAKADRAPSVKAGRPPSDDEILAKADEMKARGLDGRTIAKVMRLEPGFGNVATTAVRALIKGRWKPAGRPTKAA